MKRDADAAFEMVFNEEDPDVVREIQRQLVDPLLDGMRAMEQVDLFKEARRRAIEIPDAYRDESPHLGPRAELLTAKGEVWLKLEIKKSWRADVEFWAKLVLPVISLIFSIIALVWKH